MSRPGRCLKVTVYGRVQGVFFRQGTCEQARRLGIKGWVRNMPDGTVEALICGDEEQLAAMQAWLAEGPPLAQVRRITVEEDSGQMCPVDFRIRY